jgi:hypothetical protein
MAVPESPTADDFQTGAAEHPSSRIKQHVQVVLMLVLGKALQADDLTPVHEPVRPAPGEKVSGYLQKTWSEACRGAPFAAAWIKFLAAGRLSPCWPSSSTSKDP